MEENQKSSPETLITLTCDIVAAHVGNNDVLVADVPALISNVYAALAGLGDAPVVEEARPEPAVSIRSSVKPGYIVCLEDGKKMTMLKRYLRTNYDMSPEEYRARWNLPAGYPMIAPAYAEKRRELAKKNGLGRKPGTKVAPKPRRTRTKP
ncbi:MucR family transcriptional regulator [uncultured Erythrobacter sp.]|uniref:MucR family transcriptional regulator n=1 Tax=uncultured Erythrobacter sp. TaxID=263913 RepID=UPI00265A53C5|nr:MucR family transcriptional regulator [uncultured Erythrobacter sp.]